MEKDLDDKIAVDDVDSKAQNTKTDIATDSHQNITQEKHEEPGEEKKEDEEEDEEEEEEEEDRIIEKSPNLRFHKRNKKYMRKVPGIDNSFIAIEPKSGKEVIWNEINLSDKKSEQENRFINLIKKLKRYNHPFFVRFLEVWQSKPETGCRKIIFITERLTDPTMKQYFVNSSSSHRLTNKSLWRKFVGQLISVLKFLNHLGVNHGNLSNETVYYQNTGCLKVGTLSVDLNFDNKPSSDIYDMGKLALEMAAYEAADDSENLSVKERTQRMLSRVYDSAQCNFIEMCLDHSESPTTLSKLFQHIVLKEVPSLKRLSAKIIVQNSISTNEDDKVESQITGFSNIFKDQVSHFEDETVLFKVIFNHDNITKMRLWKEFRINFLTLPKYIEDVRNGFYPIFEAKTGQVTEEVDDITYSYSVEQEPSKETGILNLHSKDSCLSQCMENLDSLKESMPQVKIFEIIEKSGHKDILIDTKIDEASEAKNKSDSSITIQGSVDTKLDRLAVTNNDKSGLLAHPKDSVIIHDVKIDVPDVLRRGSGEDSKLEIPTDVLHPDLQIDNTVPFEDNAENELDEDDDEDEDFNTGGADRMEPYWLYVSPPDKPPSDRALFTECSYSYIGCGRWQIYVQIWFLEDRLKREIMIQVMEHEWNDDARVASMFENGKIISPADKPVLERILGYARHNCPLVDGELIPPQKKLAYFDAYDLYQRLEHLQMFSKARQLLEKAEAERCQLGKATISPTDLSSVVSPSARAPNQTSQNSLATPREPLISHPSVDEVNNKDIKISPLADSTNVDDKAAILKGLKIGELPGFKMELMDIRVLAPLNYRCMFCDNHDYLHSEELPPYLSSPCYHCREGLAKELKIPPANLFDLHQQNFIPWPAFLQVRYNIPPISYPNSQDGKTLRELIDYDCKWRDRIPCRCYSGVEYPPCVEFPNIYLDDLSELPNMSYALNEHFLDHKSPIVGDTHVNSSINSTIGTLGTNEMHPDHTIRQNILPMNIKQNSIFPCTSRHMKGASITCVHGITFPRMPFSSSTQLPLFKKHVR